MKYLVSFLLACVVLVVGFFSLNQYIYNQKQAPASTQSSETPTPTNDNSVQVTPISHASLILQWGNTVIYADPTGGAKAYEGKPSPNLILVTDIHGDHLNADTIKAVIGNASLIVPQAVKNMLPAELAEKARVLANGEMTTELDFDITGVPMYNLPETSDSRHVKGRGNGYVIEKAGKRVYIAGDTAGTPEMRALQNIDLAFIPMNMPFTMGIEEAAEAVLAFKPQQVYPYHYRGQDGLADVNKFKELVNAGDQDIEVVLLNWYP